MSCHGGGSKCDGCSPEGERRAREELVETCRLLYLRGFIAAEDGNASVKLGCKRLLVTPSGRAKGFLSPEDLLIVDLEGNVLEGQGAPSAELQVHLWARKARPDAHAVVHAHPPHAIALSLFPELKVNGVLPEVALSVGRLEVVPYARPLSRALAEAIAGPLERADAVILQRHGTLALGDSLHEAVLRTEAVEHAAHVLWLAHALGRPAPLPGPELRALEGMHEEKRRRTR